MTNVACFSTLYIHTMLQQQKHTQLQQVPVEMHHHTNAKLKFIQSCMAILPVSAELLNS